ncbi:MULTISPECIES: MAE_28990/MAE_18760 family HEPN-like nuclease [Glycomyces]|uniref:RiboL-PSP-HEPN domain-containing protein n=1 Tax=Glycomyces rutgersensis TaxID=58115 RepID=A0ABN3GE13_9ACTN
MSRKGKPAHSTHAVWEIQALRGRVEELEARCNPKLIGDDEVYADLTAYLVIRISGYLEQSVRIILVEYCDKYSHKMANSFVNSHLSRMPNLNASALINLIQKFDVSISSDLERMISEDERRGRLNALVSIRNNLAHGLSSSVSPRQAAEYRILVEEIIDWLLVKFHPN